jgi:hypothetical protein
MARLPETAGSSSFNEERRNSLRLQATYPVRIRFRHSGKELEWFSHTSNVSCDGLSISSVDRIEPGTEVSISLAIPFGPITSFPAAQLDGTAVVVRSESADRTEDDVYNQRLALKFLEKPKVSTQISMFG